MNGDAKLNEDNNTSDKILKSGVLVLLALAISAFSIGTAEFVMAGILPNIAQSFNVSIPVAGWLMTGYAAGVAISAPIITTITIHIPRKYVLICLMLFFILGNVISALAPTYEILMVGRIISALCHGAFFGIGSVVAANSVPYKKRGQAIALMFTGLTFANLIGVPMGTFLGQNFGWRSMFWAISCLGVIAMIGIIILVPYHKNATKAHLLTELKIFKNVKVWLALFVTAFGFGGVFAAFAYISPVMTEIAGFAVHSMTWLLFIFGIGLIIGNILGGKLADHSLTRSIYILFIILATILFVFTFTAHYKIFAVITLFSLGVFGFAISPPVQTQVMRYAANAPTIASAANISAFNVGIAIGTYFSGLAIHLGYGYTSVNLVGGILVVIGLILQTINMILL